MQKTILITGSTDGIGLATAKKLAALGHRILLHGRNAEKVAQVEKELSSLMPNIPVESYVADLSRFSDVGSLARSIAEKHISLDVLINNAGVFRAPQAITADGLDIRFVVNTIAPYLLTQRLLPLMGPTGRVINLSSAAQSPVDINALTGKIHITDDFAAYAQSKLAITMWSRSMALALGDSAPAIIAINPGSLLGSKMVQENFGVAGADIEIGADILIRAALDDEFGAASGQYFDNDARQFAAPHIEALDAEKSQEVVRAIQAVLDKFA